MYFNAHLRLQKGDPPEHKLISEICFLLIWLPMSRDPIAREHCVYLYIDHYCPAIINCSFVSPLLIVSRNLDFSDGDVALLLGLYF